MPFIVLPRLSNCSKYFQFLILIRCNTYKMGENQILSFDFDDTYNRLVN